MKKMILILSFLTSQVFADICTEEQYSPYFTDKNGTRYVYLGQNSSGEVVFDKKTIKYDKKHHTITVWVIFQLKSKEYIGYGMSKQLKEFNIKNNTVSLRKMDALKCNGVLVASLNPNKLTSVSPGSINENILDEVKKYLKIK